MLKHTKVKIGSRTRSQEKDQGWVIQGLPGHCRKFRAKQRSNKWGTKNVLIHIVTRVCMLSHLVTNNSATPRTADCQIPLPMGLLRQEFWSGLSFPSPGDLPDPGINLGSPALQADSIPAEPSGMPRDVYYVLNCILSKFTC